MRQLVAAGEVSVEWGVFSLALINFDGEPADFDPDKGRGIAALRVAIAARDAAGNDGIDAYYTAIGRRYFHDCQPLDAPTIRAALGDAGLDRALYDKAIADESTFEQLVTEHTDLVASTRSFGVPAIVLADGNAIFGPVISNVPATTDEAVELWRHVLWLTEYENFSELKRDRTIEPDLEYSRRRRAAKMAERGQAPLSDSSDQAV